MQNFKTYNTLKEFNKMQIADNCQNEIAQEKMNRVMEQVSMLKAELYKVMCQIEDQQLESEQMVEALKDSIYDEQKCGSSDGEYLKSWSDNKLHFDYIKFKSVLELYKKKLEYLEENFQRTRVSRNNIGKWSNLRCQEFQDQITNWTSKFKHAHQVLDEKIKKKQELILIQQAMIDELEKAINERMSELKPWEEEKEQERQDRINHLRKFYSARKIQRFWRSYMVKHTLYKKKKTPKKKTNEQKPSKKSFAFL